MQTKYNLITKNLLLAILLLLSVSTYSKSGFDREHKDMFRTFLYLMENGAPDEFHEHAEKYEKYLLESQPMSLYYKIRTNEGFYDASHLLTFRAHKIALDLDSMMSARGDTTYHYLVSGLMGDIYKSMRNLKADSIYQVALAEAGDRDPKFSMLVHVSLAQVNHLSNPTKSLEWAKRALDEAERLNSFEHRSMSLGIMAYVYFMIGDKNEFDIAAMKYKRVKDEFKVLEENRMVGQQLLDTRYDILIEVAKLGFNGDFDAALKLTENSHLNVDKQLVIYRLHGLEGSYEKDSYIKKITNWFIGLTALYIFVYIMGRRRLMKKIWKRNAELRIALEKADSANQMKTNFIRSMSHEIRTPLNAINGFTQLLCDPEFELSDEEKLDMQKRVTSNTEAITIIINELLELAAGESGTLDLNDLSPVNINDVCRKAKKEAEEHNENNLQIVFTTEIGDDFTIKSNEETILQILNKITNNAQKFTKEGSVILHASRHDSTLEISVTDTGIGIPEDKQKSVFDNFVKLDEFSEGVGLGLSISIRLARSLGGDISIDPTYKTGSRFILQLPIC